MLLFVRGGLIELRSWIARDNPPLTNLTHCWVLLTLFFASAQAFNSVLPELVLFTGYFPSSFFGRSGTISFQLSMRADCYAAWQRCLVPPSFEAHTAGQPVFTGRWLAQRVTGALVSVTLGTLDAPSFAPATGYLSFFTLGLYITG